MKHLFIIMIFWVSMVCLPSTMSTCLGGFVVIAFPGASYSANTAAMDATLGISGYLIEDFEDTVLIPGLTISFEGGIPNDQTFTSLPKTFDSAGDPQTANNFWDGTRVLTNAGDGLNGPFLPSAATNTTFTLSTAAPVVGIGLANFQSATLTGTNPFPVTDHSLFVNGQELGTVEALAGANWSGGVALRNTYLRIEATNGDLISSIRFRNDSAQDFLVFDRLAVFATQSQAVPEPASCWIVGLGFMALAKRGRGTYPKTSTVA